MTTQTDEIARLTRERDEARAKVERLAKELAYYRRDNEKLHNALAWEHNESENAMDARRYRWLRNFQNLAITREVLGEYDTLDAAIDAAMREGE